MSPPPSPPPYDEAQPQSVTSVPPSAPPPGDVQPPPVMPINPSPQPHDEAQPPSTPSVTSVTNQSTPIKKSLQGSLRFASESKSDANFVKAGMLRDLKDQFVGPMPVKDLLELLPVSEEQFKLKPNFKHNHFAALAKQNLEKKMYDPFIQSVNAVKAIPGFKLINTSNHSEPNAAKGMKNKPDLAAYRKGVVIAKNVTQYDVMELVFEFKPSKHKADPFDDKAVKSVEGHENTRPFEVKAAKRKACRAQIACYARVWLSRQHRTHCYIIYIADAYARIVRFDRSGCLVSARFNYRTQSHLLLEFLWRFSETSEEARGLDTTVRLVPSTDPIIKTVKDKLYNWRPSNKNDWDRILEINIQEKVSESVMDNQDTNENTTNTQTTDEYDFETAASSITRKVYVWGALAEPRSVGGRATRGYAAWDPTLNEGQGGVVFVKDSWRSCQPGMEKETDILQTLNNHNVRNVPRYLCGDDVPDQFTLTQDYATEAWNVGAGEERFVKRAHIRFAEDLVGNHLHQFESSRQLAQAVYDAFIAHQDAYEKCGILHRDISGSNILLRADGRGGFLNDWDLAVTYDKATQLPLKDKRQAFRSGTWQFMSISLLEDPEKVHRVQDDAESFLWVLLYYTLRYMKHKIPVGVKHLESIMQIIFDQADPYDPEKPETGGTGKRNLIRERHPKDFEEFSVTNNQPLTTMLETTIEMWLLWYDHLSAAHRQARVYARQNKSPLEEAKIRFASETSDLDMHTHEKMASAWKAILDEVESWPQKDGSVDYLPNMDKRPRESDHENKAEDEDDDPETD